jgi:hypothetical protein
MRVTRSHLDDPSKFDEVRLGDLATAVRRMPGLQSYTFGFDRSANRAVSMSTWDTEEKAKYLPDALGDAEMRSRFQAVGLQVDSVDIGEVSTTMLFS